jgi:O-antigen/teichoic acid export membrane protein
MPGRDEESLHVVVPGEDRHPRVPAPPAAAPGSAADSRARTPARPAAQLIASGSFWTISAQVSPLIVNLLLTPYIIAAFGLDRYGLFMLVTVLVTFLGSFDAGLGASAGRYLAIYAGQDDRRAATSLVVSLLVLVLGVTAVGSAALWFLAPVVLTLFDLPSAVFDEGVVLLRTQALLVGLAVARGLFFSTLTSHGRFAVTGLTTTSLYVVYVAGLLVTIDRELGLVGVAVTLSLQQLVATLILVPASLRHLTRHGMRLWTLQEYRTFFSFAARIQLVGLTTLVNQEVDAIVIGALFRIRDVAVYAAGANFAAQLRNVMTNVLSPVQVVLGNTLGERGRPALDERFAGLQRHWVAAVSGWCAVGAPAAFVGVPAWLGPEFESSGPIAGLLVLGSLFPLGGGVLTQYLTVVGEAGVVARYALVTIAVNLALTVPLCLLGPLGVVLATVLAQVAGALLLLRLARARVPGLPSWLRRVPVRAAVLAFGTTTLLEALLRSYLPRGPAGLLLAGAPAALGLVLFAAAHLGPKGAAALPGRLRALRRTEEHTP